MRALIVVAESRRGDFRDSSRTAVELQSIRSRFDAPESYETVCKDWAEFYSQLFVGFNEVEFLKECGL